MKQEKKWADKLKALTSKSVLPSITAQAEAQEKDDRLNVINQSIIGAKEVEATTKLVGSDVTDAILRTADGSDHKSIDRFIPYEVMKMAIDAPINQLRLLQEGQHQHGANAIERGTNGHIWYHHW
jgi:hypothetical protein